MAQTIKIILEDDLDGGTADETLSFGLDGNTYEIDLSEANAQTLRAALHPFVSKARRATQSRSGQKKAAPRNPETAKIRAWAQANGHNVSDRGRIHQEIQDAYYAAQK